MTITHSGSHPTRSKPDYSPAAWPATVALDIQVRFGWPVHLAPTAALLALTEGVGGLAVHRMLALAMIPDLRAIDCAGPVIALPGRTAEWVFLVDPNGSVVLQEDVPCGVRILGTDSRVPLPPARIGGEAVEWAVPATTAPWRPTLDAVLLSARRCLAGLTRP